MNPLEFSENNDLLQKLKARLQQPLPGRPAQERMTGRVLPMPGELPADARPSAVLAVIFPKEDVLHLLFIERTADGRAHGGQISFPGGRQESFDKNLEATALREMQEEVGIPIENITMLGALTPLYIPISNFLVHPFIGYCAGPPVYHLSEHEVASILEIPINHLLLPETKFNTEVRPGSMPNVVLNVPAYSLPDGKFIWGATAMILSELEVVLENHSINS